MSTTPSSSGSASSSPNDSMAGTKAQKYINSLYQALQTATSNYQTQNTILTNNLNQQKKVTAKQATADALYQRLLQNLKNANTAEDNVKKVTQFFAKQQTAVMNMVENAKEMSTSAYESLYFLVKQGKGRIDAINNIMQQDNKDFEDKKNSQNPPASNVPTPWISTVLNTVGKAQASGAAAITAGQKAVESAFKAYISNQTIYYRTTSYLNSFTDFQKQLKELQDRLIQETSLAKYQSDLLDAQVKAINERVTTLQELTQSKKTLMDEAQKRYDAAQQGASYAGAAAS